MARSYAQLHQRIWADPQWRALDANSQHLYLLLISQPQMNMAGVLPLQPRKWSSCVADWDTQTVERALDVLAAGRFVLVDEDTEEVLIRSLIRNDGGYKTPGMLRAILKFAEATQAPALRAALAVELGRLDPLEGKKAEEGTALIHATRMALLPEGTPPGRGAFHRTDAIGDAIEDAFLGTHRDGIADTSVTGTGSVPLLSLVSSVERGSAPRPRPTTPPLCKKHKGMDPEDVPACPFCKRLRQQWEDDQAASNSLAATEATRPKPMCPDHPGQIAAHCGPCRSEQIGMAR